MSHPGSRIVRSRRVLAGGGVAPATVHIAAGKVVRVGGWDEIPPGAPVDDFGDAVVMPGLVDTHVHINEPGRTGWEGFASATRAAAAGGVTTLMDMPLNSVPPTTSVAGLVAKAAASDGQLHVDVGFCGGAVPGNAGELRDIARHGALAFKCFLADSGVAEFGYVVENDLRAALPVLAELGTPLLVHAERFPGPLRDCVGDPLKHDTWLAARPRAAENEAVRLVVDLAREFGARCHIVHLSSADALDDLRRARDAGLPVSAETCPHYLTFAAEDIPDGATEYKCAPPIRERENQHRLWDAVRQGLIGQVVTDHSPSSPDVKCSDSGDFSRAWGGIASLQLGLPAVWTGARARGLSLLQLAEWMCAAPARMVGLDSRKGRIAPGLDADLVVWEPDAELRVDPSALHHKHKLTPYAGRQLFGVVTATYLRGEKIFDRGALAPAAGLWLRGAHG